ncbi:HNH endonuclease [Sphingomonas crusticola]|uniref:HNH endonuclease n=1 Tax=Sphingomonas crusticola TaxID=1697973 RepID=UPI000E232498|nr:HNH endonuclease signature motif containing protein [Sphingomonas crusticola]
MARRPREKAPDKLRRDLIDLLTNFEWHLEHSELRQQVRNLVPANHLLRDLGSSLLPEGGYLSARDRILAYLRLFPGIVIDGDELMVVAGISEYARRIRELRKQEGWPILSGITASEMRDEFEEGRVEGEYEDLSLPQMLPSQYLLLEDSQDRDAAFRWNMANQIRRSTASTRDKLLRFFRENVGQRVTSEELRYVAGDATEWARRTRELRTEMGWPVMTRNTGDPTLPVGTYVLERDEQAPLHDRHIPEVVRREVMRRDHWSCRWRGCGWPTGFPPQDHRFLEAHHIEHHAEGGANSVENLVTLCNLHHDEVHRAGVLDVE